MAPKTPPSRTKSHDRDTDNAIRPFHPRTPSQSHLSTPFHQTLASHEIDITTIHDVDSPLHFSPSKARAVAAQTQQLSILARWLASLTPSSSTGSTATHRNDTNNVFSSLISKWQAEQRTLSTTNPDLAADTTRWLQTAMETNRLADERRRLMFEAKKAEVERLGAALRKPTSRTRGGTDDSEVGIEQSLDETYQNLSPRGQEALDSLAETTVLLGWVPAVESPVGLGRELTQAVLGYTLRAQQVQEQVESLQSLQRTMTKQLEQAKTQLGLFESDRQNSIKDAEQMHPQTLQWNRDTKQISLKIKEYRNRVAALERSRPGSGRGSGSEDRMVRVENVVEIQEQVQARREAVKRLEERVRLLNGLPPDLGASRQEVKRARMELERLKTKREELFGVLAAR